MSNKWSTVPLPFTLLLPPGLGSGGAALVKSHSLLSFLRCRVHVSTTSSRTIGIPRFGLAIAHLMAFRYINSSLPVHTQLISGDFSTSGDEQCLHSLLVSPLTSDMWTSALPVVFSLRTIGSSKQRRTLLFVPSPHSS